MLSRLDGGYIDLNEDLGDNFELKRGTTNKGLSVNSLPCIILPCIAWTMVMGYFNLGMDFYFLPAVEVFKELSCD